MKKFSALLTLAFLLPTLVSCKTVSDSNKTSSFKGADTTADTAPLSLFEEAAVLRPLETITLSHVYRGEYSRFPDDLKVLPNGHFVCDGNIYVRTQDKAYIGSTDDGRIDRYGWYILSPDGTAKFTLLPPSTPLTDGMNFTAVLHSTPTENGVAVIDQNIRITQTGAHKLSSKTGKLCIAALNADGIVQWAMDPETLTEQRINPVIGRESGYEFQAHFLLCGANGTIYMVTDYSVVAVSPSGEKLYETGEGRAMENAVRTADGRILVQYRQFPENKTYFAYMDDEAKDFGEPFTLPLPQEDGTVVFGEGYDLYYHNVKGLFGMNRDDTQPTLLCNWENSCIHYDSVKAVLVLSADRFFCLVQDPMTEEYEYAILHRVSEEEMQSKKIITLGVVDGNIDFGDYAARFSRQSDEYHVVIRDYVQQRKNGGNTLEEDALAGTLPDIVVSVYVNKQIANLADKGSFVDLNRPLSIDSEFKNDLLPFVLEPFETDDALYWLNSVFTLDTMCGNAALLPEPKEWTTEIFFQFIEECEAAGVQAIGKTYREKMTEKLLYNNLSAYIDFNGNTCNFETETFLRTASYLKTLTPFAEYSRDPSMREDYRETYAAYRQGKQLIDMNYQINQFRDWLILNQQFNAKEITILGTPSPEGGKPMVNAYYPYAITNDSPVKEGAWEFIRYMMEEDTFAHGGVTSGYFPVNRTALLELAEAEKKNYYVLRMDTNGYTSYYWDGVHLPVEHDPQTQTACVLTDKEIELLLDVLEKRDLYTNANAGDMDTIKKLIDEELSAYYAGSITAEEAAKRIQSRVSIYLAEQAG